MVTLRLWFLDNEWRTVTAQTYGQAFDMADKTSAVKAIDGLGQTFYRVGGEWASV